MARKKAKKKAAKGKSRRKPATRGKKAAAKAKASSGARSARKASGKPAARKSSPRRASAGKKKQKQMKPPPRGWQARLKAEADPIAIRYGESLAVDRRLYRQDIAGSIAHATMLQEVGLLTAAELVRIRRGLEKIRDQIAAGKFKFDSANEDIHMAVEAALIKLVGDAGRKLHTGRSRNDQVALDLRLWMREQSDALLKRIVQCQSALLHQAGEHLGLVMPAYTHLQRAQPIEVPAYLLAYVEMLQRDADRFADCRRRINVCPLGAGAVAGTTLPLDRGRVAELLGFDSVAGSAIDITSERDVAAEFVFCCTTAALHLSRWAEDGCLFASQEFGFLEIEEAYCTSSSMMPQKRNPDVLELMRGRSASMLGQLVGLLALLKGLPLAYNRDLQEDKGAIFASADTLAASLEVAAQVARHSRYVPERVTAAAAGGYTDATALAEYLVGKGVPFRTAHQYVGEAVQLAESQGVSLIEMPIDQLQAVAEEFEDDVFQHLGPERVTARYRSEGAGGGEPLAAQLARWKERLK